MKFIHCADIHLGAPFTSISSEKALIRKEELVSTFERLCVYAKENEVTAVIIAGDFFDVQKVTLKLRNRVLNAIKNCSDVDFLYLCGNHDENNAFLQWDIPQNLKLFTDDWKGFRYENVFIQGFSLDEVNSSKAYSSFSARKEDVNIVVMHGQIANYTSSNSDAQVISIPSLKNKNIDYLALGHFHSYTSNLLDDRGVYVYSGTLEGRGFDELGKKGFVLIEVNQNKLSHSFIPFAKRELFEVEYTLQGLDWYDEKTLIFDNLSMQFSKDDIIKLVLKGERLENTFIDLNELQIKLNEMFFYAKVYDKTTIKIDKKSYEQDKSIKGEFIKLVLSSDLDEDLKKKVIACGLNALKGEDLL